MPVLLCGGRGHPVAAIVSQVAGLSRHGAELATDEGSVPRLKKFQGPCRFRKTRASYQCGDSRLESLPNGGCCNALHDADLHQGKRPRQNVARRSPADPRSPQRRHERIARARHARRRERPRAAPPPRLPSASKPAKSWRPTAHSPKPRSNSPATTCSIAKTSRKPSSGRRESRLPAAAHSGSIEIRELVEFPKACPNRC